MRYQGKITVWKDEQGFGFITPNSGGNQIFVHIKAFANQQRRPVINEAVSYELKTDANARLQAGNIAFLTENTSSHRSSGYSNITLTLAVVFLISIAGLAFLGKLPFTILGLYVIASIVAFVAYAVDKSAAQKEQWRTAESTLHFFALIGGWPGAMAAQRFLRHKTQKKSFQIIFWTTVALNCGILSWLFLFSGQAVLNSILTDILA